MGASLYEAIANGESRKVYRRGQVVLPKTWRDEHDVEAGDVVVMVEGEDGNLEVIPPDAE